MFLLFLVEDNCLVLRPVWVTGNGQFRRKRQVYRFSGDVNLYLLTCVAVTACLKKDKAKPLGIVNRG
jgi:hypothetical protein